MMRVKIEDVCMKGSSNLKQSDVVGKNGIYPVYGAAGYLGSIDSFNIVTCLLTLLEELDTL